MRQYSSTNLKHFDQKLQNIQQTKWRIHEIVNHQFTPTIDVNGKTVGKMMNKSIHYLMNDVNKS